MESPQHAKMIYCSYDECTWQSSSVDGYLQHLSRMHVIISGYSCIFENCNQKLSSVKSFRHHINKYHNGNDERREALQTAREKRYRTSQDIDTPDTDPDDGTTKKVDCSDELNQNINEEEQNDQGCIIDTEKIRNEIRRKRNLLTLNWISKDSVTRKAAFDIQKDISDFVIEPIKKTVELMFSVGMLTDTSKKLLDEVLGDFDVISEYKFIQQLKQQELYEDPSFFTISEELQPAVVNNEQQMVFKMFASALT